MITLGTFVKQGGLIIAAVGIVWTVGQPLAEDFVNKKVTETVNDRFKKLEDKVDQLHSFQAGVTVNQAVTQSDINTLKSGQTEARQDIKEILKGLRRTGIVDPQ